MLKLVLVCVGGALGSAARYLIGLWAASTFGPGFPVGTLTVNLVGSFLIAVIFEASLRSAAIPGDLRLFLTTGVMGGLTTYSSFNYETLRLLDEGAIRDGAREPGGDRAGLSGGGHARAPLHPPAPPRRLGRGGLAKRHAGVARIIGRSHPRIDLEPS